MLNTIMEPNKISDRFVYHKGDIQLKKYQCNFCIFEDKNDINKCQKYETKPIEVIDNKNRCKFIEIKKP